MVQSDRYCPFVPLSLLFAILVIESFICFYQLKERQISDAVNPCANLANTLEEFCFVDKVHVAFSLRIAGTKDIGDFGFADGVDMMNYPAEDEL